MLHFTVIDQMLNKWRQKTPLVLPLAITALLVVIMPMLDLLYAVFQDTNYYLQESALFSIYWIGLLPAMFLQQVWQRRFGKRLLRIAFYPAYLLVFLASGSVFVSAVSGAVFSHTYTLAQTFSYGASALLLPGFLLLSLHEILLETLVKQPVPEIRQPVTFKVISQREQLLIKAAEILYVEASTPYVKLCLQSGSHLYNSTLTQMEEQLQNENFVRVHRSHLVNISAVERITSRNNGDYDLEISNGSLVRLSRRYAAVFKLRWSNSA